MHAAAGRPVAVDAPGFVGRRHELALLRQALAAPPARIVLEGEAGIGKTRLLRELLTQVSTRPSAQVSTRISAQVSTRALVASCPPFREPHTLGPVADALRQLVGDVRALSLGPVAGALRPLFPEWAAELPGAPEPAADASVARHRVFRALAELIGALDLGVLAVDDVHWADDATVEFLLYLTTTRPRPVSVIVTYRPEDIAADSLVRRLASRPAADGSQLRLTLKPLDIEDTAGLMSSMLAGQHVSGEFAAFVHQHAEGVPLAVEESVRLMGERDDLIRKAGYWVRRELAVIEVPPSIRDSVLERAERLTPAARQVLRSAAVLGEPAAEALITAVSRLPAQATTAGLAQALASGLLAEDERGRVTFRHVLAQRAVYQAIAAPRRRELHRQAGDVLQGLRAPAARLARHYREGGDEPKFIRYGRQAVEFAVAAGDEITAASLIGDLLASTPGADVIELLDKINFASLTNPERYVRELIGALRRALGDAGLSDGEQALARFQLARLLRFMNDNLGCRAELERAIPYLTGDPARAAWAMTILGWPYDFTSPAATHRQWLRRAESLSGSAGARTGRCDRVTALLMLGDPAGWAEVAVLPDDSSDPVERRSLTIAMHNVSELAIRWGRYQQARQLLSKALRLADTNQYLRFRDVIVMNQARLDWFTGNWPGVRQARSRDDSGSGQLDAILIAALLDGVTGARAKAADGLRFVLAERRVRGESADLMEPAAALARLALATGDVDAALTVTEEPIAVVAAKGVWLWAAELAPARVSALTAAGRCDDAELIIAAFARWLRGRDVPAASAGLITAQAILAGARGQLPRAARLFGGAAAAWQDLPRPYDGFLAGESLGRCLLSMGKERAGLDELRRAADGLAGLGACDDARRVARTLAAHGVRVKRQRPGRPGYGGELSPRELDVARLLVAGGTNKTIGEQLFLSPKTVAKHVASAMRKLDVTSRTALAVRLVDRGVVPGEPD